jgi:hypothetical protein
MERRSAAIDIALYVTALPGMALWVFWPRWTPIQIGGFVVFIGAAVVTNIITGRIPCPRCGKPLGKLAYAQRGSSRLYRARGVMAKRYKRCPHCRLGLDEPIALSADPK